MRKVFMAAVAVFLLGQGDAKAAAGTKPAAQQWSFSGIFGTFDRAQMRRGLQVYTEVCASCHSLNLVAYRHLAGIGMNEDEIKAWPRKARSPTDPTTKARCLLARPASQIHSSPRSPMTMRRGPPTTAPCRRICP